MKKNITMPKIPELVITETNCITAVGHDGEITADSIISGTSRISFDEIHEDEKGRPIKTAVIDNSGDRDNETEFMAKIAVKCLTGLCDRYFEEHVKPDHLFLFLGLPSSNRPGPAAEIWAAACASYLENRLSSYTDHIQTKFFQTGNASAFNGIRAAFETVLLNSEAVCIVGGIDSLLSEDTLDWLEKDWRLVSETQGRQHGLFPSHAAGFFIVETEKGAAKRKKKTLARIISHAITQESAPFVSDLPSQGDGLTKAIQIALENSKTPPSSIDVIFCDLNGEHHRFREWGFAEIRCFPENSPVLVHPADCMGDIGAAWLPVLTGIASEGFKRGTFGQNVLMFCTDDHGERGAMLLCKAQVITTR